MINSSNKLILKILTIILICIIGFTAGFLIISPNDAPQNDFVSFLSVGQGDSTIIHSNGYTALIDTGTPMSGLTVAKELRKCGINRVDVLILTHPHDDHIGGAEYLIGEIAVDSMVLSNVLPNDDENAQCLNYLKQSAAEKQIKCYTATAGMVINIGNFELTILMSDDNAKEENDTSVIIMVKNGEHKFLFTGDAEAVAERKLIKENINFDCDVLKVGHHGSNTSSIADFLKIASPEYAVISVGKGNSYGHPHGDVLSRLADANVTVLRTDILGNITFQIVEGVITLKR